jgi:chromosome segregation ATPase
MDDTREFKLKLNDNNPDLDLDEITRKPDKTKMKNRSMIVILFAVVAFGAITIWMYYNFQNKIQTINTKGSEGIADLTMEFNDKLFVLSEQLSDQKKATQNLLANLNQELKNINVIVSSIQTDKSSKNELETAIGEIKKDITPLQKKVETLNGQLNNVNEQAKRMSVNLNKIQTGVLNNKKEISTVDAIQVDRTEFEAALKKEREFHENNIAHTAEALFSEIAVLQEKLKKLYSKLGNAEPDHSLKKSPKTKTPSENLSAPNSTENIE